MALAKAPKYLLVYAPVQLFSPLQSIDPNKQHNKIMLLLICSYTNTVSSSLPLVQKSRLQGIK